MAAANSVVALEEKKNIGKTLFFFLAVGEPIKTEAVALC